MDRREALRRTAMLMGGALSAPSILGVLNGCTAKPGLDWKPEFLKQDEAAIVTRLTEIIIPATDTLGAKEVGVPGFIDQMLKDVYSKEEQKSFMEGLKSFNEGADAEYGDAFHDLSPEDQESYAVKAHKEALRQYATNPDPRVNNPKPFFLMMKELTLLGYFTSEEGATKVLQYVPVPGAYNGCVPLQEAGNGKTWAT